MDSILQPGSNCCVVARAHRVALLVDGAAYFEAFRRAALQARHSLIVLGWDFDSRTQLHFGADDGAPTELGGFLNYLARRRRSLRIRILNWDYPVVFGTDRETRPLYGLGWTPHRHVDLRYDDTHPFAGSQHQKVAVIDDAVAFTGGIDLSLRRWDIPEHPARDPRREFEGTPYPPVHDLMVAVDGEAARALGNLARARWHRATGERLRPPPETREDPWPRELAADIAEVDVGIALTAPAYRHRRGETPAVREVEQLYLDMIAAAKASIYIENQYFTSPTVAAALARRLAEPEGPEVILVLRLLSHGWLEEHTMHILRTRLLQRMLRADVHGRFRVLYPCLPGLAEGTCLDVHSKLMLVDDELLRIGSSNLSNRSMGVDTECDLLVEARGRSEVQAAIRAFRAKLLAEHLDCAPAQVAARLDAGATMREAIEALGGRPRTLKPLDDIPEWSDAAVDLASVADPAEPLARDFFDLAPHPERDAQEASGSGPAWGKLAAIVAVLAALAAAWRFTPLAEVASPERVIAWAKEFGSRPWAPWVVLLAYTPACFVLFPRPLITLTAVIAFGPWLGFVLALTGTVFSAGVTYFVGRHLRRDTVRRLAGRRLDRMIDVLKKHGLLAMTLLRLVPLAPFAVEGVVAGAVRLKLWHLLAGTAIGLLPGTLATTIFGEQIEAAFSHGRGVNWWLIAGVGLALACGTFFVRRWFRSMAGGTIAAEPR